MDRPIRKTRSVCPLCLKNIPAELWQDESGAVTMKKSCCEHGEFTVPVWRGKLDFESWTEHIPPLGGDMGLSCPTNCGICAEHESGSCCVLLEVTKRCNLRCRFCFANGGSPEEDESLDALKAAITDIVQKRGNVLLQLSGGEPTLRNDLPELVRFAKSAGCSYVQLNTNGIRLAEDEEYAEALKDAGLDIVFLQFDGTKDEIYEFLRGRALLAVKEKAIDVCAGLGLGVTLVPTVVPGVNTDNLGELVRYAAQRVPAVRAVHFQPVSYFGRFPNAPENEQRYTLDQLMSDIAKQSGIGIDSFMPSRCDHPLCGFHANYIVRPDGSLKALSNISHSAKKKGCAVDNRAYVGKHWTRPPHEPAPASISDEMDFDTFLYCMRQRNLCLSSMAFQDAMNLNIERLHQCTLHVYENGTVKPFCANYLSPMI
jgi:uncharacterized radical SAM superfamily Fe-S cluster-containing enzyme